MAPHLQRDNSSGAGRSAMHHETNIEPTFELSDIGKIIDDVMSSGASAMRTLSVGEKYHPLKDHFAPPMHYKFPSRFLHQCQRCFQPRYLRNVSWMIYSPSLDVAFCQHCASMMTYESRKNKGAFVNKPFTSFMKKLVNIKVLAAIAMHNCHRMLPEVC